MSFALDALILISGCAHVLLSPYTKVEESFNLHAVHDVLMYGVQSENLHNYDHFTFPGAVPRTFIGSVLLAWISKPVIQAANSFGLVGSKFDLQIIVRLVLSAMNALGLCILRRSVSRRFGRPTSMLFTFMTITQFHLPFWMGRTLPNMFAMLPVNVASSLLLDRAPSTPRPSSTTMYTAIKILISAAVILRAELALLLAPIVLQALLYRYVSFAGVIKVGIVAGLGSIALTTAVDSYFWKMTVWPEFSGIYFNIFEGKSSEWGTSPPLTYFTAFLPKLLITSLPLSLLGFSIDSRIRELLAPHIAFIGIISCLGHKEWRFIVYSVPVFNVAAARAARAMVSRPKSSVIGRLLFLGVWGMLLLNLGYTGMLTMASRVNYPGGEALARFNENNVPGSGKGHHVHISNLAAQTGASLFLQVHAPPFPSTSLFSSGSGNVLAVNDTISWTVYDKTEGLTMQELTGSHVVTHMISEYSPFDMGNRQRTWKVVEVVSAFDGWRLNRDAVMKSKRGDFGPVRVKDNDKDGAEKEVPWWMGVVWMETSPRLWIYGRR